MLVIICNLCLNFYSNSETLMKQQADLMVELGFKDAGYEYVIVDDCWPNKEGRGVPNIFSKYSFVSIVFLKINSMNNY